MDINDIIGVPVQLTDFLAELAKEQEELLTNPDMAELTPILQADSVNISSQAFAQSQNMLSRNSIGGRPGGSTYLDAQKAGANAVKSLQNSMNSALGTVMNGLSEAAFWYGDPRMRRAKMMKDATESNAGVFAGIKSSIEGKAAEAMAPKDENGEPIAQVTATGTTFTSSAPASAAPAPDIDLEGVASAASALSSISVDV